MKKTLISSALLLGAVTIQAGNLWIVGDALSYGWDLDKAASLVSDPENASVYTGTLFLFADKDFKLLTQPDWGNTEYGAAPGAALVDGTVSIAAGSNDEGYDKLKVAEDANYLISVNTETMEATFVKSEYQESPVNLCALYLVGSATAGSWDVMASTPLYQDGELPFDFESTKLDLSEGAFKIATSLKGASSWNADYWYFRDAEDPEKIALGQEGDLQWEITENGKYTVKVDLNANSISISKNPGSGISFAPADGNDTDTEFFTLSGMRVLNPSDGIFIRRQGAETSKVIIR